MNTEDIDTVRTGRRTLLAGFGAAALGLMALQHDMLKPKAASPAGQRRGRIPNPIVTTHEGRQVRFYDDLIRDKVVAINMTYAQCSASCPATIANMIQVQKLLGERIGREVFMYSITLFPELDTPRILKAYAEGFGVKPGWQFLTGAPSDIEALRFALGFYDQDPLVDADRTQHANMIRIGNAAYDRWTMSPGLASPEQILSTINHVDRSVVHTAHIPPGSNVGA